jgi:hypothetical protein
MYADTTKNFIDAFLNDPSMILDVPLTLLNVPSMLLTTPLTFFHTPSTLLHVPSMVFKIPQTPDDVPLLNEVLKITKRDRSFQDQLKDTYLPIRT